MKLKQIDKNQSFGAVKFSKKNLRYETLMENMQYRDATSILKKLASDKFIKKNDAKKIIDSIGEDNVVLFNRNDFSLISLVKCLTSERKRASREYMASRLTDIIERAINVPQEFVKEAIANICSKKAQINRVGNELLNYPRK